MSFFNYFKFVFRLLLQKLTDQMIQESLKIKLNQFMLAYERQCAQFEFQKQNIKQNVMLSIIEDRSLKNNNQNNKNCTINSQIKAKQNSNLSSSKQTKFSEQKILEGSEAQNEEKKAQQLHNSKLMNANSRLLQKSNISVKSNRVNKTINNYINSNESKIENRQQIIQKEQKDQFSENLSTFGRKKGKNLQISQMCDNKQINVNSQSKLMSNKSSKSSNYNGSQIFKNLNSSQLKQKNNESSLTNENKIEKNNSKISVKLMQKQLAQIYSDKASNMFQKSSIKISNSQHQINKNPSLMMNEESIQDENFPTFHKPSFHFLTNMSDLRQSDPNNQNQNNQNEQENDQDQYEQQISAGKWNSRKRNHQSEQRYQHQQSNQFQQGDQQHQYDRSEHPNAYHNHEQEEQPSIQNLEQNQSMMENSEINQNKSSLQDRKNYVFEINMDKSNIPSNQSIEQLKKKKILELQRKRQQRMQNNSKRKQNASEIANVQKQQKTHSNVFIGNRNHSKRQNNDNRDSLNKSINQKKSQKRISGKGYKNQDQYRQSILQDNKTIITKYGEQSKLNNRSPSPLNTVKTIQTDKRPPLNRNKKQENIFAPESGTFQRQKSLHKSTADPKIVPVDRKNSFQKKSNIKIMANAITYVCLPGQLNRRQRQKLIDVLEKYQNQYFVFLFKQYSRKVIKGIYILDGSQQRITKIFGEKAPAQIFPEQVHQFYRFDSGSRQFKKIDGCKSFSFSVHAIDSK